jgi:hypothetical protein
MSKAASTKGALLIMRTRITKGKAKTPRKVAKAKATKQAKAKKAVKAGKERRADGLVIGSDAARLVDAICSKSGATHGELKKLVGWKSCLPYAMKSVVQAKVRLRKEREGREVRFFGTPA